MSLRLELRDVRAGYERGPDVLAGLSLAVQPGAMVALLGPNGGGKTTLLRLASGVLAPRAGTVSLDGEDVGGLARRALARRVAVLPQEASALAGWTVREVVSLGRTPYVGFLGAEGPRDRRVIAEALRLAGCEELAGREHARLSGGERQRVALASALAQEPDLLLLDEPTAHLDLHYRAALLDAVLELRDQLGLTVLAAMHDPSLAALYFGRIVLLSEGEVLADGSPTEVLTEPLLGRVYGAPVRVTHDPALGAPVVTVLPARLVRAAGARGPARRRPGRTGG